MLAQLDYVYFCYGLAFFLLALVAWVLHGRRGPKEPAWALLAAFALMHGCGEWTDLGMLSLGRSPWSEGLSSLLCASSFGLLMEFGRQGLGKPLFSPWLLTPFFFLALLGAAWGGSGFAAAARYALALPGALLSAWTFLLAARDWRLGWGYLVFASLCMVAYGLVAGMVPAPSALPLAVFFNQDHFLAFFGMPVQMVRGLLTGLVAFAVFEYQHQAHPLQHSNRAYRLQDAWFLAALALTLAIGWGLVQVAGSTNLQQRSEGLLDQAAQSAAALDPQAVEDWLQEAGPTGLTQRMQALQDQAQPGQRFLLLAAGAQAEWRVVSDSPQPQHPEWLTKEAGQELWQALFKAQKGHLGPLGMNRSYLFYAPILGQNAQLVLVVPAAPLMQKAARVRLMVILTTGLVSLILFGLFWQQQQAKDHAMEVMRSERQYRQLFESSSVPMLVADPQTRLLKDANAAAAAFYHYSRVEMRSKHWQQLCPEKPLPDHLGGALRQRHHLSSGEEREVEVHTVPLEWEGRPSLFVMVHDMTEEALAREALILSDARYRSLLEHTSVVVYSYSIQGALTYVSPGIGPLSGWRVDDLLGRSILDFVHPDDRARAGELATQSVLTGMGTPLIVRLLKRDGSVVVVEETSQVVRDRHGMVTQVVGTLRDVTESRKAEEEKHRLQTELHQSSKLASIGLLAAGVAHEVNNPLTVLKSSLFILRERAAGVLEEPLLKAMERMDYAVDRVTEIVGGLRTYARADREGGGIANLHAVVADTLNLVENIYRKDGVVIHVELRSANPWVRGSAGWVQQILMNLISNARDATLSNPGSKLVRVITWDGPLGPCLQVQDNGCGMTPEQMTSLFKPFFTTKPPEKGTGLGLSVSQTLARQMGGRLEAESTPAAGSRFTLILCDPNRTPNLSDEPAMMEQPKTIGANRVLVVDDEEGVREALRDPLVSLGQTVVEARGGLEALEILKSQAFDIVITDVRMPDMGGDELLSKVHALRLPHLAATRYLVISGGYFAEYSVEQRQRIMALAHGYLLKPFSLEDLRKFFKNTPAQV
jgi:PAS domain S-box-containing protein